MSKSEKRALLSMRLADMPNPRTPSTIVRCDHCDIAVWRAKSSPKTDMVLCMQCGLDIVDETDRRFDPPTAKQLRAIRKATHQ
jgi:hypothetical protein